MIACPPFAFAAHALRRDGQEARFAIATAPGIVAGPDTFWRAASISKIVTGEVVRILSGGDGARSVAGILGWPLRHPSGAEVTLGQLAAHSAGLTDEGGYLVPPEMDLRDWIAARGDTIWTEAPPGAAFRYSNLGYVLLAACAEALGGESFDRLAQRLVLGPRGIMAGFNWAGLPADLPVVATYRRDGAQLLPQIDAPRLPAPPGRNPGRFSPQGGLRVTLAGALRLAEGLRPTAPLWRMGQGPAEDAGGLFQSYGWGLMILPRPTFWPNPLIGHFGNAYGFRGGVWRDETAGLSFAYALNGFEIGDESDDLTPEETGMFDLIRRQAGI